MPTESETIFISIEEQARRLAAELFDVPIADRSDWLQVRVRSHVAHLVGYDRVTVAFYLGMHVGNNLSELERARGLVSNVRS